MTAPTMERKTGWIADASTLGARLALIRQKMGWGSVAEAARACGLPVESWRTWERDGVEPRRLTTIAKQISTRTGCDYLWLLLGPDQGGGGGESLNRRYRPLAERVIAGPDTPKPRSSGRAVNRSTRPEPAVRAKRRRPRVIGPSTRAELAQV